MGSGEVMERYWMLDHILSEQSDNIRVAAGLKVDIYSLYQIECVLYYAYFIFEWFI